MLEIFLQYFVLYFVVIDPIGTTPLFLVVTKGLNAKDKNKVAFEGVLIATIVLLFFAFFGNYVLKYLGISFPAFTIAGGVILFLIALEMLFDIRSERKKRSINDKRDKISIFPIAIPLLAGPAAITSVILTISQAEGSYSLLIINIICLISVMLVSFVILRVFTKFQKFINEKIINIFSRVIGIILAALSIQYILDGIKSFF
ncbi:MarC family protein [Candidatus Pelagibacter sp.]|jgi:multiple antibiotic resistance protein|nr:MarC family protein [Candidatus Pelagibacter sp.]MDC0402789.1 MarC family protein [Candidatus Pelagibacter sp.]MDC0468941.1 MarC family protein [Candidatus Pelagibacter sp.]MDC0899203.1 MarC family protein [Candidatus Pelagibacter sp.]MDC1166205.1 MarC family protein [Candidatus Pelagibacter sp.]